MKITVLTAEPESKKWLSYVLEILQETSGFEWGLQSLQKPIPSDGITIGYAPTIPEYFAGVFIPEMASGDLTQETMLRFDGDLSQKNFIQGHEVMIYHEQNKAVMKDGVERCERGLIFHFDLFQNIFLRLSCAAEREYEKKLGPTQSYLPKEVNPKSYEKPIVNYLIEILMAGLRETFPSLCPEISQIDKGQNPFLFSHDVDAIVRTPFKAAKQTVMNLGNFFRCGVKGRWSLAPHFLRRNMGLNWGINDFDKIDFWQQMDSRLPELSLFHFFVKTSGQKKNFRSHLKTRLFDPDYDLTVDSSLLGRVHRLHKGGFRIGLHGSYESSCDAEKLSEEKARLEELMEVPCHAIRQHWLRFSFQETWRTHEDSGFMTDTGFGFNNQIGFRSWFARPFHPWDEKKQRAHKIWVIPMIAMDSTMFDYLLLSETEAESKLRGLFAETQKFGGQVNINWHTHGASRHFNWQRTYTEVLEHSLTV